MNELTKSIGELNVSIYNDFARIMKKEYSKEEAELLSMWANESTFLHQKRLEKLSKEELITVIHLLGIQIDSIYEEIQNEMERQEND